MNFGLLQNVLQRLDVRALNIHTHPNGGWAAHARIAERGFTIGNPKPTIEEAVTDTLGVCGYSDPAAGL